MASSASAVDRVRRRRRKKIQGLVSTRTDPVGQALGQLLDAVRQTSQDGTWPRLKVCARDTCRWAFYDASRNQVRRWCSMAGCGNHVKMKRAYATRKARAGAHDGC